MIKATGTVKFGAVGKLNHQTFTQHFVLAKIDNTWLVVSDTIRLSTSEFVKKYNT